MTTRAAYLSHFKLASDAVSFEEQALAIGSEFLPSEAIAVRDGGDATPAYWSWLIAQAVEAEQEWAAEQAHDARLS